MTLKPDLGDIHAAVLSPAMLLTMWLVPRAQTARHPPQLATVIFASHLWEYQSPASGVLSPSPMGALQQGLSILTCRCLEWQLVATGYASVTNRRSLEEVPMPVPVSRGGSQNSHGQWWVMLGWQTSSTRTTTNTNALLVQLGALGPIAFATITIRAWSRTTELPNSTARARRSVAKLRNLLIRSSTLFIEAPTFAHFSKRRHDGLRIATERSVWRCISANATTLSNAEAH
mmetsp:Transcript_56948/g.124914  ORF Transcript_56948/g.124914 Transcript_56948/m.124914 type:complete len:231 (-) Transcript_56948:1480-2172(-)